MKWQLDTGTAGCDEVLEGDTRDEVLGDILHHHDLQSLPDNWTLEMMDSAQTVVELRWEITTAKGGRTGDLLECLEWQAEYQGALAELIRPDGVRYRLDQVIIANENDPAREDDDLTPDEAARMICTGAFEMYAE